MSNNTIWWKRLLHSINSNWFRPHKVEPVDPVPPAPPINPVDPVPPAPPIDPVPPVPPVNPVTSFVQASGQSLTMNGKAFIFRADTAWLLTEYLASNRAAVCAYLDQRKSQGFNAIMIGCDGRWFNKDASAPNEGLFGRLDATFADAEARGMFIILCPQVTAYDNDNKPYCHIPRRQSEAVGLYYGQRYGGQRNLICWMIGGADDKGAVGSVDLLSFARGIRTKDLVHIITYHPRSSHTSLDVAPVSDLHGMALYQSYHVYDSAAQRAALTQMRATGRPFCNIEGPFEGTAGVSVANVVLAAQLAKEYAVCGFVYGHTDVWPFNKNWKKAMTAPGVTKWMKATK
jgi:hypothetical protein